MARAREVTKVTAQSIVDPGVYGVEDYYERLSESGLMFTGAASATEQKDYIDDVIAEHASRTGLANMSRDLDALLRYYQTSLWIYACTYQIASNLATVPLIAEFRRGSASKWEAQPDSDVQAVIDSPTSLISTADVVERMSTFMELCGTEVIVAQRKNGDPMSTTGPIVGLQPLRPSRVWIIAGKPFVEKYLYFIDGEYVPIDPANAEMIRYFNPLNDYWGQSPISTIQRTLDIDTKIEQFNQSTLEFGGVPEVVLETDKDLSRGNARRYRLRFEETYLGPKGRGGVVVLDGGMKLKPVGLPPKDMQFEITAKIAEQRVLSVYGVPPVMVMDFRDASVLANAADQIRLFYKLTLKNKARRIEEALTRLFRRTYGPYWRLRFAFEQVDVTKDPDQERTQAVADYGAGLITQNEARMVGGRPPLPGGDEIKPPPAPPIIAGGGGGKGDLPPPKAKPKRLQAMPEFKALARAQYKRATSLWLPKLRGSMRTFFKGQRDRVLASFRGLELPSRGMAPMTIAASAATAETKATDPFTGSHIDDTIVNRIFDVHAETDRFLAEVGPVFLSGLIDSGNSKIDQLAPSMKIALNESHWGIRSFYAAWGASRVVDINESTEEAIKEAVTYGFEHGYSTRELEEAIVAKFQDLTRGGEGDPELQSDFPEYRLERIARTETATMLNAGSYEGTKELVAQGSNVVKSWLSSRDNLVRDSHAEMDDDTSDEPIPFNVAFDNGLQYPNDPAGPPEEVINCRCSLIEQVVDEGEQA
jgi:HK97 family phage portal protein